MDANGDASQAQHVIYKFNNDTGDYEHLQYIYYGGKTYKYNSFEINGKMYIFQANYESYSTGKTSNSRIYVYKDPYEQISNETAGNVY